MNDIIDTINDNLLDKVKYNDKDTDFDHPFVMWSDITEELDSRRNPTFEEVMLPVLEYLNNHYHPHTSIIVTLDSAEIVEGVKAMVDDKYVKD